MCTAVGWLKAQEQLFFYKGIRALYGALNCIIYHLTMLQFHHLSEKPGNVREFDSCQGNVRDFTKNQGNVREKILLGKSCLKLFTVGCIFVSIQVFSRHLFCVKY